MTALEAGDKSSAVSSDSGVVTAYLPEDESSAYYRLTDGRGYISRKQLKENSWIETLVSCSEVRLQGLVTQCEQWIQTHLPYRPVRFDLPGPGSIELKVELPEVGGYNL